jgi:NADH-quinone oxidoreductase subunit G
MGVLPRDRSRPLEGVKAHRIVGADPVGDGRLSADSLRQAGFVVVQELFLTETAKAADVVLPAASWAEREGSFTSGERRVQRFYPAVTPKGRPDYEIACEIGARVGVPVRGNVGSIMAVMARTVPAYAGLTYQKLAHVEKQFPDVGGRDLYYGGTSYENRQGLGVQLPSGAERGDPVAAGTPHLGTPAQPEPGGLTLVPITVLYDRGTTFIRSLVMHPRLPLPYVELNAADAAALGVGNGDEVVVSGDGLEARVTARVDGRAPAGVALMPASLGPAVPDGALRVSVRKA